MAYGDIALLIALVSSLGVIANAAFRNFSSSKNWILGLKVIIAGWVLVAIFVAREILYFY